LAFHPLMNPLQFPHKPPVCEACTIKVNGVQFCFGLAMSFILWIKTVNQNKHSSQYLVFCRRK